VLGFPGGARSGQGEVSLAKRVRGDLSRNLSFGRVEGRSRRVDI
jgi:hypothetical protein